MNKFANTLIVLVAIIIFILIGSCVFGIIWDATGHVTYPPISIYHIEDTLSSKEPAIDVFIDSCNSIHFESNWTERGPFIYQIEVFPNKEGCYLYGDQRKFNAVKYHIEYNSYGKKHLYLEQYEVFIEQRYLDNTTYDIEIKKLFMYRIDVIELDSFNIKIFHQDTITDAKHYK